MALAVEDGTGKADADALVAVAYCDTYHSDRGNTGWTGDPEVKEEAIRRATTYLSDAFSWAGRRLQGRDQALEWPRTGVIDHEGYSIPSNEVPKEVAKACAEAALRELAVGNLTPDYTPSERLEGVTVDPLTVKYDLSRVDAESVRPIMLIVRDLIDALLDEGAGSRLVGEAHR